MRRVHHGIFVSKFEKQGSRTKVNIGAQDDTRYTQHTRVRFGAIYAALNVVQSTRMYLRMYTCAQNMPKNKINAQLWC